MQPTKVSRYKMGRAWGTYFIATALDIFLNGLMTIDTGVLTIYSS